MRGLRAYNLGLELARERTTPGCFQVTDFSRNCFSAINTYYQTIANHSTENREWRVIACRDLLHHSGVCGIEADDNT